MEKALKIHTTYANQIPVIHLEGKFTSEYQQEIFDAYGVLSDKKKVILNFQKTEYINSSGIAVLIQLHNKATQEKGIITFAALNPSLRHIIEIVGLTDFVKLYESEQEAAEDIQVSDEKTHGKQKSSS